MEHRPWFFSLLLIFGLVISSLPCHYAKSYRITQIMLCPFIFSFYFLGTRGTNDLINYQQLLEYTLSKISVVEIPQQVPYEFISIASLWLFREFENGAFIWHGLIVVFLFISIIFFMESLVGKKNLIPGIAFIAVLPPFFGEFILNQSRQLLATSFLIISLSFLYRNLKNLWVDYSDDSNYPIDWGSILICLFLLFLAFLCHYSSAIVSIQIIVYLSISILRIYKKRKKGNYIIRVFSFVICLLILSICIISFLPIFLASSLDQTVERYSVYQTVDDSYRTIIEGKNMLTFELYFFILLIGVLINRNKKRTWLIDISVSLLITGFITYIFCIIFIITPQLTLVEFGRRYVYYGLTIQMLGFSLYTARFNKYYEFLLLSIPFIAWTFILIFTQNSGLFVF